MYWLVLPLYFLLLAIIAAGLLFAVSGKIMVSAIAFGFIILVGCMIVCLFPPNRAY